MYILLHDPSVRVHIRSSDRITLKKNIFLNMLDTVCCVIYYIYIIRQTRENSEYIELMCVSTYTFTCKNQNQKIQNQNHRYRICFLVFFFKYKTVLEQVHRRYIQIFSMIDNTCMEFRI